MFEMGCGVVRFLERYVGDLDDALAYSTTRTVRIRDRRLGGLYYLVVVGILCYILGYQVIVRQAYLKPAPVTALARLQLQRPSADYRWPDTQAPYCAGPGTPDRAAPWPRVASYYAYPQPGLYEYTGPGAQGVLTARLPCLFFDENFAVPNPLEANALFLTTRFTTLRQEASPANCTAEQYTFCSFNTTSSVYALVADAEMFTLLIDHSMAVPSLGISRTASQMAGNIQGYSGQDDYADPCAPYVAYRAGCPSFVAVGVSGLRDIVPLKSLLNAAGISSLDQVAGTDPTLSNETLRYSGLVLLVEIFYSNQFVDTGSYNTSDIRYTYRVATVRNSEFKAQGAVTADNIVPSAAREIFDRHGVRIVVSYTANVGGLDLQTLLVNLTVSLGLLSVAVLLIDVIALRCCPLNRVYRLYKERATIDFEDLRRTFGEAGVEALLERLKDDEHAIDPLPSIFVGVARRGAPRGADADAEAARGGGGGGGGSGVGGGGERVSGEGAVRARVMVRSLFRSWASARARMRLQL